MFSDKRRIFLLTKKRKKGNTNTMTEKESSKGGLFSFKNVLMGVASVVLVIAVASAVYFYMQYYQAQQLLKNPSLAAQQQTQTLLASVGKLIDLPKGETPTIATVSDVTKLKDQPFFANAKNGDKVIIYTNAKKAILYSPMENKIVDVAPVNIGESASPTPATTGTVKKVTPTPTKAEPKPTSSSK